MSELACPTCGTELSPAALFADADAQQAFARLAAVSIPLGARVMAYLTLFTPPKTRLTVAKQCKLLLSLLPDLERQAIHARGRDWPVPLTLWAQAFEQLQASRAAGRLELPLRGHGYLHAVLVGLSEKHEAIAEAEAELARRRRPHGPGPAPGSAPGPAPGPGPVAAAAAAALPLRRDPELLRLEAHASRAVPMPQALRERLARPRADVDPPADP